MPKPLRGNSTPNATRPSPTATLFDNLSSPYALPTSALRSFRVSLDFGTITAPLCFAQYSGRSSRRFRYTPLSRAALRSRTASVTTPIQLASDSDTLHRTQACYAFRKSPIALAMDPSLAHNIALCRIELLVITHGFALLRHNGYCALRLPMATPLVDLLHTPQDGTSLPSVGSLRSVPIVRQ